MGEEFTLLTKQVWADEGRRQLTQSEQSSSHSRSSLSIQVLILCPVAAFQGQFIIVYFRSELLVVERKLLVIYWTTKLTYSGATYTCLQNIIYILFCFELQTQSQLHTLVYYTSPCFALQLVLQTGEQLLSAITPQTRPPLPPSCSSFTPVIPPFQMTMTYWVFGPEVVANLTLGPIIFLSMCQPSNDLSVPRAQWSEKTLVSVWGERWSERGVEKQLRCWLLTIKTFPSTNTAAIDACQTQWTTVAPVTEHEFEKSSRQVFSGNLNGVFTAVTCSDKSHLEKIFLRLCNFIRHTVYIYVVWILKTGSFVHVCLVSASFVSSQHPQLQLCPEYGQTLDHAVHRPHETHSHGIHQLPPSEEVTDSHVCGWLSAEGKCDY